MTTGTFARVCIVLVALAVGSLAAADPIEGVRADLERKYPQWTGEIRTYLALFGTDDAVKLEKAMGELAIRAAAIGDYSALYRYQRGGPERVQRAFSLLGYEGGWNAFWQGLDLTTRRTLLQNPIRFVCLMDILQSLEDRPDAGAIKQVLQEHPSLAVVLWRVPALAGLTAANRNKLLPFLVGLDYGGPEGPFDQLNDLIQTQSQSFIELLENPQAGAAAAMTLWAVPEIFDEADRVRAIWPAVAAQGKFIRDLRAGSKPSEWPKKAAVLRDALRCSTVNLSNQRVLLLLALNPGGELLEEIYRTRQAKSDADFRLLADFLDFCMDWNLHLLPGKVVWATADTVERRVMMEVAVDKRFIGPDQRADRRLIPLGALAILQFGKDAQFRRLLVKHRSQLVLYLYKDGDPQTALRNAARFRFADVAWDESWFRSASTYLPFGEIVNICYKSWMEYPIDRKEWVGAVVDAADMAGAVVSAGMSQTAAGPLSMSAKEAAQKLVETTLTGALKDSLKSMGRQYVQEEDERSAEIQARIQSLAERRRDPGDNSGPAGAQSARGNAEFQGQVALLQAMTAEHFGIPYKPPADRHSEWILGKQVAEYAIPAAPDEFADALRADDASILLVTLAQYQNAPKLRSGRFIHAQ